MGVDATATLGPRPVNHPNVLVRIGDAMDVEESRRNQRTGAGAGGGWTFTEQFHVEAAFFLRLAQRRLLRVFIQFDVPAQWQPPVQFPMMNQQHLAIMHNKNGDGEINFFVNVGHG